MSKLYDYCPHCEVLCEDRVEGYPNVKMCHICGWVPPYAIAAPPGEELGISPGCQDHQRGCFGSWSIWPYKHLESPNEKGRLQINGDPFDTRHRQHYQVQCTCSCHEGQPTGLDAILSWYKRNPNELEALRPLMPVHGDTMRKMVEEYGTDDR